MNIFKQLILPAEHIILYWPIRQKALFSLVLAIFLFNMVLPAPASASMLLPSQDEVVYAVSGTLGSDLLTKRFAAYENDPKGFIKSVLSQDEEKVVNTMTVVATAYSSDPAQTDDTPCITADNFDVCQANEENVLAANFLRFGTKVRIPELYGDKVFIVHDRMNPKYDHRVDLWKTSKNRALSFGIRLIKIEILES